MPLNPRRAALALSLALAAATAPASTPARAADQTGKGADSKAAVAPLPQLATEVAFPQLPPLRRPVAMARPDRDSRLIYIVEQDGRIWSFDSTTRTSEPKLFLDIRPQVNREGNEEGLLGLAFHPKFAENGQAFIYYSAKGNGPRRSVVSRIRVKTDDPRAADPASEEQVWVSAEDPFNNHNGGCIEFGPDGYLYISLGDSGAADDPLTTGQNPKDWFGSILRVDVDKPSGNRKYGIPADNPALRDRKFAHWAPEVYCIGLRNVWKFTFDRETGELWAGDVGQNKWEMVHKLVNGGNYGWSLVESFHAFRPRQKKDPAGPIIKPIAEYPHGLDRSYNRDRGDTGQSITGGYVYRGKAIPGLVGAYVYGDYQSGRVWGVREKDGKATINQELVDLNRTKHQILAFGEDADGELYILAEDGRLHRLISAR